MALIPPAPVGGQFGSYTWQDWYEKVRRAINNSASIAWSQITNFTGSNLTSIVTRLHSSLQGLQGGNGTTELYHTTAAENTYVVAAAAGNPIVRSTYGMVFNPATSAGFDGIKFGNESNVRKMEILYFGSTSAGGYGAAANGNVINSQGTLALSVSDVLIAAVKTTGLEITGDITTSSTTLHKTSVALTNGAAAAAGTLGNAPVAGNPTKWVPINDNGTTRYIPCW